jgi:hypothetical protein
VVSFLQLKVVSTISANTKILFFIILIFCWFSKP